MLNYASLSGEEKIELYRSVLDAVENVGGIIDFVRLMKIARHDMNFQSQKDFCSVINELIKRGYIKLKIRRVKSDEKRVANRKFRMLIDVVRV